jgi:hypothetical protein
MNRFYFLLQSLKQYIDPFRSYDFAMQNFVFEASNMRIMTTRVEMLIAVLYRYYRLFYRTTCNWISMVGRLMLFEDWASSATDILVCASNKLVLYTCT